MTSTPSSDDGSWNLAALNREYDDACEAERLLWAAVHGKHPGQPGHDPQLWQQWMDAAKRVRMAAEQRGRRKRA
jgi:hypothetical protein